MRRWFACLILLVSTLAVAGCASGTPSLPAPPSGPAGPPEQAVTVVSNGWHSVVVARRDAVAATGLLPEAARYPEAEFLEFGWGDRSYFPAREKTLGMTLDAAMVPTPAVLHLAGLARLPEDSRDVVELELSRPAFDALVGAISAYVERPVPDRPAEPVSTGLTPGSDFYAAKGRFHLLNTCNTWTLRVLQAAGVAVEPSGAVTAGDAMERLRLALAEPGTGAALNPSAGIPGS